MLIPERITRKPKNKLEALNILELFCEKVDELRRKKFVKKIFEENVGFEVSGKTGHNQPIRTKMWGPEEDYVEAFVLTLRFFFQQRDCSIFVIEKFLKDFPETQYTKNYLDGISKIKKYLLQDSKFEHVYAPTGKKTQVKNDFIIEVFLYGQYAHANTEKKIVFDSWIDRPPLFAYLKTLLLEIFAQLFDFLTYAQFQVENIITSKK